MSVLQKPRDESLQARAIGLNLVGHRPIRSRGGYSNGPGRNATFRFGCPRFPRLAPLVVVCLVTNELLSSMTAELGTTAQTLVTGERGYGRRALQDEALKAWQEKTKTCEQASKPLIIGAKRDSAARWANIPMRWKKNWP